MGMDAGSEELRAVIEDVIEQARQVPPMPNTNHQTITVHHADPPKPTPWQAWACVTACVVMVFATMGMGVMYLDLRRTQDRTQDHLSTIYLLVPDLRKQVEEILNNRKGQ